MLLLTCNGWGAGFCVWPYASSSNSFYLYSLPSTILLNILVFYVTGVFSCPNSLRYGCSTNIFSIFLCLRKLNSRERFLAVFPSFFRTSSLIVLPFGGLLKKTRLKLPLVESITLTICWFQGIHKRPVIKLVISMRSESVFVLICFDFILMIWHICHGSFVFEQDSGFWNIASLVENWKETAILLLILLSAALY